MRTLRTLRTLLWLVTAALPLFSGACAAVDEPVDDEDLSPFSGDEGDEPLSLEVGKADSGSAGYRTGCGAPIRTGSYALKGDVVTPTGVLAGAYVVVQDEKIAEVRTAAKGAPSGMTVVDTKGYIFPGLIDGHGHVEYNHIPLADLGKRYQDRDQWPGASLYKTLVKAPKNAVTAAGLQCEALKHGEIRGLVGGTTAMQGTPQIACVRGLTRNVEQTNFCKNRVRQNVTDIAGFNRSISGKPSFAASVKADLAANRLDAVIVHAGEGIDDHAHAEWGQLKALGFNIPQLVMIHTTAFNAADYQEISAAGAKVVWSPLSNLLLYGRTADIPSALDAGVLVSLGSDWAPSGSANLLGELKVADHVNQTLWHGKITDEELVQMVTINPATAFGLAEEVGSIEVGKYADLMVVRKAAGASAYRSLINARPQDVLLVAISGDALFGTQPFMDALGKTGDYESVDACGETRVIDVTVSAADVTKGTEKLADIESKLQAVNPKLTPVIDCTNDEALKAYLGTNLQ
jgi:cytosine/adenosine deaminase-related metal-dependent hydrolase